MSEGDHNEGQYLHLVVCDLYVIIAILTDYVQLCHMNYILNAVVPFVNLGFSFKYNKHINLVIHIILIGNSYHLNWKFISS